MNIGNGIKKILTQRNVSQKRLASETGLSETSISLIIKNKTKPRKETIELISQTLNINPEALIILSIDKEDVPDSKKEYYDDMWPMIEKALLNIFSEESG